jgi:outer membrane protein assembly factor BamA
MKPRSRKPRMRDYGPPKRWARLMLMCGLALAMGACAAKKRAPIQGELVKTIGFQGNGGLFGGVADSSLRNAMEQSQSGGLWWLKPSERAVTLERKTLATDAWRIETWYANNGYFDARLLGWDVMTVRKGNREKNKPPLVKVIGYVKAKKPSIVRNIKWENMEDVGNALLNLLRKKAALKKGDQFTVSALKETEGQTLNQLHELSHGFATITSRVDAFPEENVVDVYIMADMGPPCRFGKITVTGKIKVPKALVMDEVTIKKGRAFRASTLAETQRRLFSLGVFSVVNVMPDLSKRDEKVIPVRLELSESKYKQVRVGGGFLFESGKQDVHGTVEFKHVNVFNRLWNFTAMARPGYAWITTLSDVVEDADQVTEEGAAALTEDHSPTVELDLTLEIPRFPARGWRLTNELDFEYGLEEGYKFMSPEAGPFLSWQLSEAISLGVGYRIKFFKYYDLEADDTVGSGRFGLNFTNPYILSYLNQQIIWNTRDNALFPTEGEYIIADISEAGGPFSGGFNYLFPSVDIRVFRRVRKLIFFRPNVTLAFRAGGGAMFPYKSSLNKDGRDEIPFAERLFLGGSNSVRGWIRNHLGPYVCDAENYTGPLNLNKPEDQIACAGGFEKDQVTKEITPIGGTTYINTSFEIRKYFLAGYGIVVFNDWGMVWNDFSDVKITQLLPSAGAGFRYKSPIGAIRLDGAYRFNLEPMFGMEPPFQIHFGLSEAF